MCWGFAWHFWVMECMKALGVRRATLGAASLSATLFTSTYFAKASYKNQNSSAALVMSTHCAEASYEEKAEEFGLLASPYFAKPSYQRGESGAS